MPTPPPAGQNALDQAVKEFMDSAPASAPKPSRGDAPSPHSTAQTAPLPPAEEMGALRSAYAGVLKHEAEKAAATVVSPPPLWRRLLLPVALLLLAATSAYVWFGNPAWLAPPPHVVLTPPATPISGQRQLVAIALEIDEFRRTTGRLPKDLTELGLNVPHITYHVLPDTRYEVRLGTGPHAIFYVGGSNAEPRLQSGENP